MSDNGNGLIELAALWETTSANGDVYWSGSLGTGGKLLVFKNKHKSQDNHPDYVMFLANKRSRQDSDDSDDTPHPF